MIRRKGASLTPAAAIAVASLLLGAVSCAWMVSRLPGQLHRIEGRLESERALARLAARERAMESDLNALRTRAGQPDPAPDARLRDLSSDSLGEQGSALESLSFRAWNLRRLSVHIPTIEPALLGQWMAACEKTPSAWRLGSLKIVATDPQGRAVRAETIWEYATEGTTAKKNADAPSSP